jgi:hypothetical protein
MKRAAGAALLAITAGAARAAEAAAPGITVAGGITPREAFLAAAIAAMFGCGLLSFFLAGRTSARTHVALAMLVVLIGGFSLLTLFGLAGRETPVVGGLLFVGLIGLFKLMNQFEIRRRHAPPGPARPADRPGRRA